MTDGKAPSSEEAGCPEATINDEVASNNKILGKKLAEKFPAAFSKHIPLRVGIFSDILAVTDISPHDLTVFLASWCLDPRFLKRCYEAGAARFDLTGAECGVVDEAEAMYSRVLFDFRHDALFLAREQARRYQHQEKSAP